MDQKVRWGTFFSQSGKEICDIAEAVGRWPDKIITNKRPEYLRVIDKRLYDKEITYLPNKPSLEDYQEVLKNTSEDTLITLHGWLRVVPKQICESYKIFNGHPGLITPEFEGGYGDLLKGKDPQWKAYTLKLPYSGSVIHKVTVGVDEGRIIMSSKASLEGLDFNQILATLRDTSLNLWKIFFKTYR